MQDMWPKPTFLSLPDQVTKAILSQIISGRLKSDDALPPQRELARSMNVALSVIREAIQRLEALGVVRARRGMGTFVQPLNWVKVMSDESLLRAAFDGLIGTELWETRHVIEREIVRLATMRRTPESLAVIEEVLLRAEPPPVDYQRNLELNREFHLAVAKAAGNAVLEDFLAPLLGLPLIGVAETFDEARSQRVWEAHRLIYDAISVGDVAAAEAAMDAHLKIGPVRKSTPRSGESRDAHRSAGSSAIAHPTDLNRP